MSFEVKYYHEFFLVLKRLFSTLKFKKVLYPGCGVDITPLLALPYTNPPFLVFLDINKKLVRTLKEAYKSLNQNKLNSVDFIVERFEDHSSHYDLVIFHGFKRFENLNCDYLLYFSRFPVELPYGHKLIAALDSKGMYKIEDTLIPADEFMDLTFSYYEMLGINTSIREQLVLEKVRKVEKFYTSKGVLFPDIRYKYWLYKI